MNYVQPNGRKKMDRQGIRQSRLCRMHRLHDRDYVGET